MAKPAPIVNTDLRVVDSYHYVGKPHICRWIDKVTYPLRVALGGREYHQRGPRKEASITTRLGYAILLLLLFPYTVVALILLLIKRIFPGSPYPQLRYPDSPEEEERASYRADLLQESKKS